MRIEARTGSDDARSALAALPGVKDVSEERDGEIGIYQLRLEANSDPSEEVMRLVTEKRWGLRELTRRRPTLEDVFVELTHTDS